MAHLSPADSPAGRFLLSVRVAKGAILLDRHEPRWFERVDLDRLAMESQTDDVLGQLYGDFIEGFRAILAHRPPHTMFVASECGFTLSPEEQDDERDAVLAIFAELTEAWRNLIRSRLNTYQ